MWVLFCCQLLVMASYNPEKVLLLRAAFDIQLTKSIENDGRVAFRQHTSDISGLFKKGRLKSLSN